MIDDPLIGRQLANFKIERVIGRGGMAVVYYGQDVKLRRPVAIKVIDARYRDNPTYAERFVHEAQTVAMWRHEHIIHIYYAGDEDGLYYFVMEYVEGTDLGKYIAHYASRHERIPHKEVLRIGRAVAGALDYAHQRGVVHRDVKPANVLLASDGRIVLTDFGLAMDVQQGSFSEVFGSSLYIAPEQARRSADAVPQSDQYSLGVMLYQVLTGALPFDDPSPASVALQHMTRTPPPPRQLNPALNIETENVLLKALSKSPSDRFVSCRVLLDALERALSGSLPPDKTLVSRSTLLGAGDETLIGLQLDEYRIEAVLGHGGMARLYRARDTRLNRLVAIKVIDTPFRADADYVARFKREAQAIALLDHPNIVRLYRSGEVSGMLYMAMQYVTGRDLQTILDELHQNNARLPNDRIQRLSDEVGAALDYAHVKGIIHRDVKPSNIIIDQQDRAILTDFGLALLVDSGTRGEIFGSPYYISPEQAISSANVTRQSDLYSLGVILYELLTGQVPFTADNPLDVAMLHMTETPRPPSQLNPQITPAVEAVVLKALAKESRDRYQTGEELAQALKQALRAAPTVIAPVVIAPSVAHYDLPPIPAAVAVPSAQPIVPPQPIVKRKGRKRLGCVVLLLLWVALLIGAGVIFAQNQAAFSGLIAALIPPPAETETSTATPSATATIDFDTLTPTEAAATLPSVLPTATQRKPTITATPTLTATQITSPLATPSVTAPSVTDTLTLTATLSLTPTPGMTPTSTPLIVPPENAGSSYQVYLPIVMKRYRARR